MMKVDFKKSNAYYTIECKRLDGSNLLNRAFVDDGVFRFIDLKYSSYYKKSGMLGFVVEPNINLIKISKKILEYQNEKNIKSNSIFESKYEGTDCSYEIIRHIASNDLKLDYIFFDFSSIIELN